LFKVHVLFSFSSDLYRIFCFAYFLLYIDKLTKYNEIDRIDLYPRNKMAKSFQEFLKIRNSLNESGDARVQRILWGDVPTIKSVGIITAYNPYGKPPLEPDRKQHFLGLSNPYDQDNRAENNKRNERLKSELTSGNYGPIDIKGKFGGMWERSFLVPNISREEIVRLGDEYEQEAVIWGSAENDPTTGHRCFRFEWIESGKTTETRNICGIVQDRNDYFSVKKNRKFTIPFFDDPLADYVHGDKRGTIRPRIKQNDSLRKAECNFAENEISFFSEPLLKDPIARPLVEQVWKCEKELYQEGHTPKHYWIKRGKLRLAMSELRDYLARIPSL
jgi:hypothetical protein